MGVKTDLIMKRTVLILMAIAAATAADAQRNWLGVEGGGGLSYAADELFFNEPVAVWQAEAYCEHALRGRTIVGRHLSLRAGVGVATRGSEFSMYFAYADSQREGRYVTTSLQVPLRIVCRFGLDKEAKESSLLLWVGPTLRYALKGAMSDRQQSTRYDSELVNFECDYRDGELFGVMRRAEASIGMGTTIVWKRWTVSVLWDMGIVPLRPKEDALPMVDIEPSEAVTGYYATSRALIVSAGCRLPLKQKMKPNPQAGPAFM